MSRSKTAYIIAALILISSLPLFAQSVVVQRTNHRGKVSYAITDAGKLKEFGKKVTEEAAKVREAYKKAVQEWKKANKEQFPLKGYVIPSWKKINVYLNKKSAQQNLQKLNERLESQRRYREAVEKANLSKMSPKNREKYLTQKAAAEKGFKLLEAQLNPKKEDPKKKAKEKPKKKAAKEGEKKKEGEDVKPKQEEKKPEAKEEGADVEIPEKEVKVTDDNQEPDSI